MSAADPNTDDLADRLVADAATIRSVGKWQERNGDVVSTLPVIADEMEAAAAELRRLRHTVATLTGAIGDPDVLRSIAVGDTDPPSTVPTICTETLPRIAAAVEALDGEGRDPLPATCPTCGWIDGAHDDAELDAFTANPCPDPWHGEGR